MELPMMAVTTSVGGIYLFMHLSLPLSLMCQLVLNCPKIWSKSFPQAAEDETA